MNYQPTTKGNHHENDLGYAQLSSGPNGRIGVGQRDCCSMSSGGKSCEAGERNAVSRIAGHAAFGGRSKTHEPAYHWLIAKWERWCRLFGPPIFPAHFGLGHCVAGHHVKHVGFTLLVSQAEAPFRAAERIVRGSHPSSERAFWNTFSTWTGADSNHTFYVNGRGHTFYGKERFNAICDLFLLYATLGARSDFTNQLREILQ